MRNPEGSRGASSGNISSIGANTSSEQAPTAFSSIPVHICKDDNTDKVNIYARLGKARSYSIKTFWTLHTAAKYEGNLNKPRS